MFWRQTIWDEAGQYSIDHRRSTIRDMRKNWVGGYVLVDVDAGLNYTWIVSCWPRAIFVVGRGTGSHACALSDNRVVETKRLTEIVLVHCEISHVSITHLVNMRLLDEHELKVSTTLMVMIVCRCACVADVGVGMRTRNKNDSDWLGGPTQYLPAIRHHGHR